MAITRWEVSYTAGLTKGREGIWGWRDGERKVHNVKYKSSCFIPEEMDIDDLKHWRRSLPKRRVGQLGRMRKECRRVTSQKEQYKGGLLGISIKTFLPTIEIEEGRSGPQYLFLKN